MTIETLDPYPRSEIVIALIGAAGTDLPRVQHVLQQALGEVNYSVQPIKLSDLLHEIYRRSGATTAGVCRCCSNCTIQKCNYCRIVYLMDCGNDLRNRTGNGEAVALLGIAGFRRARCKAPHTRGRNACQHELDTANVPRPRTAYIFHSLKHPEEARILRAVYGNAFVAIFAYADREARVRHLAHRIAMSHSDTRYDRCRTLAEQLIERDYRDETDPTSGQNVIETYPRADLFVDTSDVPRMRRDITRFIQMFFGHNFYTPTRDEYAMFLAVATSRRSAHFSRQVGAVITTPDGNIVAVGCNEVPKPGGGMYWEDDQPNLRKWQLGQDANR